MKNILIVEDDVWLSEQFAKQIGKYGFNVWRAHDSLDAIDQIDKKIPDVLVLDISLPGVNGLALLHEISTHGDLSEMKIIVCSSHALSQEEMAPYGVSVVVDKTRMDHLALAHAVKRALDE